MADSEKLIKIVLLGYKKTGKTKFCEYIDGKNNEINFSEYISTSGASYLSKSIIYNNHLYKFEIWDTSGQEKFESLTKFFFKDANIVFIFFKNLYLIIEFYLFYFKNMKINVIKYILTIYKYYPMS